MLAPHGSSPPQRHPPAPPSGTPLASWRVRDASQMSALRASVAAEVRRFLDGSPEVPGDVGPGGDGRLLLVISELVTNAVKYGGGAATVCLYRGDDGWLIDVVDENPHEAPVVHPPDPRGAGQRGLLVIDRASTAWGWHRDPASGAAKHVWACVADRTSAAT